jgi:aspartyl/asparaginyl beta-hydroxylase (cupin superfamily)
MSSNFEAHLMSVLASRGLGEASTERVNHAVGLLLGKRQIFLQQPTNFYFPELPQIEFYERREFPWVEELELQTPRIRSEAQAILGSAGWAPYIESETRRPNTNANPLLQDSNWSAFYLIKDGGEVPLNAGRCPATMAALREVPLCRTGRTPSVLFSLLRPGTRIRPHHGFMNTRLICHLPLIIPEQCALRVGNETRVWRQGEVVLFDDSVEHEAWNLSKELRVVMIFDVWRPELSEKERTLVGAMLEAVDQFDRLPQGV